MRSCVVLSQDERTPRVVAQELLLPRLRPRRDRGILQERHGGVVLAASHVLVRAEDEASAGEELADEVQVRPVLVGGVPDLVEANDRRARVLEGTNNELPGEQLEGAEQAVLRDRVGLPRGVTDLVARVDLRRHLVQLAQGLHRAAGALCALEVVPWEGVEDVHGGLRKFPALGKHQQPLLLPTAQVALQVVVSSIGQCCPVRLLLRGVLLLSASGI
mmetsp:Transcript_25168/g.66448  ORF Transcript_25168/g.66448 Transcript_25168/m.66448 type:complete len:217 (+) Transcript_25168:259-909(+)